MEPTAAGAPPRILAVTRTLPPHVVEQDELIRALQQAWAKQHHNPARVEQLHHAVQVKRRHLALPLEAYEELRGFRATNDAWQRVALELGAQALSTALYAAGLRPEELDHLYFVTVTGLATPSIDARLVNRLELRPGIKRTPIFGLGCVAGAAGLARASDALRAFPGQTAALLSVELCSLTFQRDDLSIPNLIASGLFGDGAAAVVLGGAARPERRGPQVVATRSVFYADTEEIMGWEFGDAGFRIVLSGRVPEIVREHVGGDVDGFLAAHGLARKDVKHWLCHTGGPKVLEAMQEALALPEGALARSWSSLAEVGNLSSASVLFVLADLLASDTARPGDVGLLLAMGPGFCAELVLLRW